MKNLKDNRKKILTSIMGILELPPEIVLNTCKFTITGKEEITIENYSTLLQYSDDKIRLNTACGNVCIEGKGLNIELVNKYTIVVKGIINGFFYE